jgi:aromatic ring-opening dioxygenase catalytic subunit (LigB family)
MSDIAKGSEAHKSLERLPAQIGAEKPNAIVVVTAHWEGPHQVLVSGKQEYTKLLYDYGGFPDHTYQLEYKAPAQPQLAKRITDLLNNNGIGSQLDTTRNWDHGVFIPLKVMFPKADIPVVAVSILQSYDPQIHVNIGKALAPLRDEGVLIIGSGYATHNFNVNVAKNTQFVDAVCDVITNASPEVREKSFVEWEKLPGARDAHAQEDHLMPLHVVIGASGQDTGTTLFRKDSAGGFIFANWGFGVPN